MLAFPENGSDVIRINKSFFVENRLCFAACFLFICGLSLGCFAVSLTANSGCFGILPLIKSSLLAKASQSFFANFGFSLLSSFPALIMLFLAGNCSFGWLICLFVPLVRGFSVGLISGCLYSQYELVGIGFFSLILLPGLFISSLVLIISACESFRFSLKYFSLISPNSSDPMIFAFIKLYSVKFLIFFGFLVLSSLIDAAMSAGFIHFFNIT